MDIYLPTISPDICYDSQAMNLKIKNEKILIGNSFPFSLVRCKKLTVERRSMCDLQEALLDREVVSFWGHDNTRKIAEKMLGVALMPKQNRAALSLSKNARPMLDGNEFDSCWLLSPDYPEGFRPAIGIEIGLDMIRGWHVLKLIWKGDE